MGVGKTVVGKALAEMIGMDYVDIDEIIVERTERTIPEIFAERGESAFRKIERAITHEIARRDGQIIVCGGGTVLNDENLASLRRTSKMILLNAQPEIILERIEAEGETRPLLMVKDRLGRIQSLLEARKPSYILAADFMIDTTGKTPKQAAKEILEHLKGDA